MMAGVIFLVVLLSVLSDPSVGSIGASISPSENDDLPSDVPFTMMDHLNNQAYVSEKEEVSHVTSLGTVTGFREPLPGNHIGNHQIFAFRGIPYASPPIGELRWTNPKPLTSWENGRLDARTFAGFCPQYDSFAGKVLGQEDCLYLNIFTPKLPGKSVLDNKLLPVFVFIHGGGYIRGSSSAHGPHKLLTKDIVLVTLNYRLGAFGFLSTGDSELPGNYGLLDQESALVWVQNHISEFGGDPGQVTLGGFSAGSVSTHIHALSPRSKGLLHSAILMSGSATASWSVQRRPLHFAKLFAESLDCPFINSSKLRTCLELKSTNEILIAQKSLYIYEFYPVAFAPVVDASFRKEPFLPDLPLYLTPHTKIPIIIGYVQDEGLLFSTSFYLGAETPVNASALYSEQAHLTFGLIANDMNFENQPYLESLGEKMYFSSQGKQNTEVFFNDLVESMNDYYFIVPAYEAAQQFAKANSTVYSYMMSYRDIETPTWCLPMYSLMRKKGFSPALLDNGVSHGDDLIHIFSFPYAMGKFTPQDQQVSDNLITLWTNFIITGSPQGKLSNTGLPSWLPMDNNSDDVNYYHISLNPIMMQGNYKSKVINFFKKILPELLNTHSLKSTFQLRSNLNQDINTCNSQGKTIPCG